MPSPMNDVALDAIDRQIIGELAQNGRISFAELGRRVSLSSPAVAERVKRLELSGVIAGYRAEIDPRALGYQLTAIVRVKPAVRQLSKIAELAAQIPQIEECLRITGEDCFYMKLHLSAIEELPSVLDQFLLYGETTTSIVNATPVRRRDPPAIEGPGRSEPTFEFRSANRAAGPPAVRRRAR